MDLSRREWLALAGSVTAAAFWPGLVCGITPDLDRLVAWSGTLRSEHLVGEGIAVGTPAARTGELARGTPYVASTLDAYIRDGGNPRSEPLTLSLTRFDCVTLVESCLAVARAAGTSGQVTWKRFGHEVERMRYRHGERRGYSSRLHYFSEWITDGARRGLVNDLGGNLGGIPDERPLRFMTEHRDSYPALADSSVYREIEMVEQSLDQQPRKVVSTKCIPKVMDGIQTGDVLGFATDIPGLDATHAAFAYRDREGTLRVLHAPLSGGVVQVSRTTLPEYVAAIRHATGILVARPLKG